MHKSYVVWAGKASLRVAPVKMSFGALLDELEMSEEQTRPPRISVGNVRSVGRMEFPRFCRERGLIHVGAWHGFLVFTRPDLIWPPMDIT